MEDWTILRDHMCATHPYGQAGIIKGAIDKVLEGDVSQREVEEAMAKVVPFENICCIENSDAYKAAFAIMLSKIDPFWKMEGDEFRVKGEAVYKEAQRIAVEHVDYFSKFGF